MNCVLCKQADLLPGKVTVTLERGDAVVIIKEVPAEVCRACGEYYLDETVTANIYARAEDAVNRNLKVEILRYAA